MTDGDVVDERVRAWRQPIRIHGAVPGQVEAGRRRIASGRADREEMGDRILPVFQPDRILSEIIGNVEQPVGIEPVLAAGLQKMGEGIVGPVVQVRRLVEIMGGIEQGMRFSRAPRWVRRIVDIVRETRLFSVMTRVEQPMGAQIAEHPLADVVDEEFGPTHAVEAVHAAVPVRIEDRGRDEQGALEEVGALREVRMSRKVVHGQGVHPGPPSGSVDRDSVAVCAGARPEDNRRGAGLPGRRGHSL